jgi:four helix bundle protein
MRDFRNLKVWEKAHRLTIDVYRLTRTFPKEELYGLTSQARRASASIACNIAEGCGRNGAKEFARFLDIAAGSASELEYHLLLARDLGLVADPQHGKLAGETRQVKQMLTALLQRIRNPESSNPIAET